MRIALLCIDAREAYGEYDLPAPYFGTAPQALIEGFAQCPEAEVHVVSCIRQPMISPVKLADNIWYHSLLVPKLGWMSTGYQGCIRAVRTKLREIQPDVVHGQGTERDSAICAVFSGFPNVVTIHGNMRLIAQLTKPRPFSYGWLNAHLEAFTLPRTDGIVCITRYTQEAVRDLARQTWVVPNAVDSSFYGVEPAPEEPPIILCVAHICDRKNQAGLIRALDGLAAERPFRLVFLGKVGNDTTGTEFPQLLQTRPWCEHAGFADRATLRSWLARATLLALPSLEDNCPMTVLEAMAAGVPVLAGNVGGVPDLVEDHATGLLCDPLDADSMRRAVAIALADRAMIAELATRARDQARARFHPRVIAMRHLEIYREVLSAKTGRSQTQPVSRP
jgi:glycosyltransferase involved in cell wall biosynthesis